MNVTLKPARRRYVDQQVKSGHFANHDAVLDAALHLMETRDRIATGQTADALGMANPEGDIAALVFIVLMQATKDMNEDLKAIMAEVRAKTAAKQQLRELIRRIRRDVAANSGFQRKNDALDLAAGLGSERAYHRVPLPVADPETAAGVRFVATDLHPGRIQSVEQLQAILDDLTGRLDSMSEMGEMESLRLQMMMDRRSKVISTLSNIMKKMSTTQDVLVQNLK